MNSQHNLPSSSSNAYMGIGMHNGLDNNRAGYRTNRSPNCSQHNNCSGQFCEQSSGFDESCNSPNSLGHGCQPQMKTISSSVPVVNGNYYGMGYPAQQAMQQQHSTQQTSTAQGGQQQPGQQQQQQQCAYPQMNFNAMYRQPYPVTPFQSQMQPFYSPYQPSPMASYPQMPMYGMGMYPNLYPAANSMSGGDGFISDPSGNFKILGYDTNPPSDTNHSHVCSNKSKTNETSLDKKFPTY